MSGRGTLTPRPHACPGCGAPRVVPMREELPPLELMEAAARHELVFGGRAAQGADSQWMCLACGARFGGRPEAEGEAT